MNLVVIGLPGSELLSEQRGLAYRLRRRICRPIVWGTILTPDILRARSCQNPDRARSVDCRDGKSSAGLFTLSLKSTHLRALRHPERRARRAVLAGLEKAGLLSLHCEIAHPTPSCSAPRRRSTFPAWFLE